MTSNRCCPEPRSTTMQARHMMETVQDYEPFIGREAVDRILEKGRRLSDRRVAHINSTYYGGGVAGILSSLTLLMRSLGVEAEWRAIQGPADFFTITKRMHNALQGAPIRLTELKKEIYEEVVHQNAVRNRFDHDFVVVHDPQPLPLVRFTHKRGPWIWRCHIDLGHPSREIWEYLTGFIEQYDAVIESADEYRQPWTVPQVIFQPAIDPFSIVNRELSDAEGDRPTPRALPHSHRSAPGHPDLPVRSVEGSPRSGASVPARAARARLHAGAAG